MCPCTVDVSCCIAFSSSCSRARLKWGWMIYVYKSQFSVQWKSHTLMLLLCLKPSQLLLLGPEWVLCVRFSLKHFRPKSLICRLFGLTCSSSSAGLNCARRRRRAEECSYSSHLVCLLSSPCCVALDESCSHLLYFCCESSGTFLLF